MSRRALAVVAATTAMLAGCGSGKDLGVSDLADLAQIQRSQPFAFVATRTTAGIELTVRGVVADDHRYRATIAVDAGDVFEEIVIDDARYLRVLDPSALAATGDAATALAASLGTGWVVDPTGAPAEFDPPAGGSLLDPTPALTAARFLAGLGGLVGDAARSGRWNPDSIGYLARDDKFAPRADAGQRFDLLPAIYDRDGTFAGGVPRADQLERLFRYAAVWVSGGRITRVEVVVDPPPTLADDVLRVQRLAAERAGAPVPETPTVPLPVATAYTFEVLPAPGDLLVAAPDGAAAVDLGHLVGATAAAGATAVDLGQLVDGPAPASGEEAR